MAKRPYFTITVRDDRLEMHTSIDRSKVKNLTALAYSIPISSPGAGRAVAYWLLEAQQHDLIFVHPAAPIKVPSYL